MTESGNQDQKMKKCHYAPSMTEGSANAFPGLDLPNPGQE
jgi:hypothetical protein